MAPGAIDAILRTLETLGFEWDGPVLFQSRRIAAYHAALDGSRGYLLHEALAQVGRSVQRANEYVQSSAPWTLAP